MVACCPLSPRSRASTQALARSKVPKGSPRAPAGKHCRHLDRTPEPGGEVPGRPHLSAGASGAEPTLTPP